MLPLRRAMQRRLLAGIVAALTAVLPLSARAASAPDVNALWNEADGVRVDSALYVVQVWWNGINQQVPDDPTQRGLAEMSQANTDLLVAHTLLEEQRNSPDPQPVALIDPLLSTVYNAVTGSNIKAPLGSWFDSINQSLLKFEGRGSKTDITRGLLQDFRIKQAVALRDLRQNPSADLDTLLAANADRERAWLARIKAVATPRDGLAELLDKSELSTKRLVAQSNAANGKPKGKPGLDIKGGPQGKRQSPKGPADKKK